MVVLDRDGTLIVDRGYLADPAGIEFLPGAIEGLRRMAALGLRLMILTNQSGIARGLVTPAALEAIHLRLGALLRAQGLAIEGIYVCPHGPADGCECRKPATALLLTAARELEFDPAECIVVGDKESDVELGRRVGALAIRVGPLAPGVDSTGHAAAATGAVLHAATLAEAAERIRERLTQA